MNSDIIFQINVIAISVAIVAFISLAFVAILLFIFISMHIKYSKKVGELIDRLDEFVQNLKSISSFVSDETTRIDDSLKNIHNTVDNITDTVNSFTRFLQNIDLIKYGIKKFLNALSAIFLRKKSGSTDIDDEY